jgi:hypothetical protein
LLNPSGAKLWSASLGVTGDCIADECALGFMPNGDLMSFLKREAVQHSKTIGKGAWLVFVDVAPYIAILDGNHNPIWWLVVQSAAGGSGGNALAEVYDSVDDGCLLNSDLCSTDLWYNDYTDELEPNDDGGFDGGNDDGGDDDGGNDDGGDDED